MLEGACLCRECWELDRLVSEISDLAKETEITDTKYPRFFEMLFGMRKEWDKIRRGLVMPEEEG